MKHLTLIVLLFFFAYPVLGQDAAATAESNPIAIVTQEAEGNTTVEDGGTVINIEAPIDTPAPPVDNTLNYVVMAFVGTILLLGGAFYSRILQLVGSLISPQAAAILMREGAKLAIQDGLNRAQNTETTIDDEFFIAEAEKRGFLVAKDEVTGRYQVKEKPAAPQNPLASNPNITNIHTPGGEVTGGDAEFR